MINDRVGLEEFAAKCFKAFRAGKPRPRLPKDSRDWSHKSLRTYNLRGINFYGANLLGADLTEVDFRDADLRGARFGTDTLSFNSRNSLYSLSRANLLGAKLPIIIPVVKNIDYEMYMAIQRNKATKKNGLDMSMWHGADCNEDDWCETTHCRAGYAICLAGAAGFALEKEVHRSAEVAGTLIFAASRPHLKVPDFYASQKTAMDDIRRNAKKQSPNTLPLDKKVSTLSKKR